MFFASNAFAEFKFLALAARVQSGVKKCISVQRVFTCSRIKSRLRNLSRMSPPSCHDFILGDRSAMAGSVNRYEIDSTSSY